MKNTKTWNISSSLKHFSAIIKTYSRRKLSYSSFKKKSFQEGKFYLKTPRVTLLYKIYARTVHRLFRWCVSLRGACIGGVERGCFHPWISRTAFGVREAFETTFRKVSLYYLFLYGIGATFLLPSIFFVYVRENCKWMSFCFCPLKIWFAWKNTFFPRVIQFLKREIK